MASRLLHRFLVILILGSTSATTVQADSGPYQEPGNKEQGDESKIQQLKKGLALVEKIIEELESFQLPENGIRLRLRLADLLWSRDQARARALFGEAVSALKGMNEDLELRHTQYFDPTHLIVTLRQEILQVAAKHDPKLALDFLRTTRPAVVQQPGRLQATQDAQLAMNVAIQVADKDPEEAIRIGADALKHAVDYQAMNLLYKFQSQNNGTAQKFLDQIVQRLREEDFNKNPAGLYVVTQLLHNWAEHNRAKADPARRTTHNRPSSTLDDVTAQELSNMVINVVSNIQDTGFSPRRTPGGMAYSLLQQLRPLISEIERLPGVRLGALRNRVAEFDKFQEAQQGPWKRYQELMQSGTIEELVEAAKTAPPEFADNLVRNAMWKAFNEGNDIESVRRIAEHFADPRQRAEMMLNISRQLVSRAHQQRRFTEARNLLSQIASVEEKASFLLQLATTAETDGNKSMALEFVSEAEMLLPNRPRSYSQLTLQLQIARVYQKLDGSKNTGLIERAIEQLNELAAAALVLDGFDVQQYFRNGEFVINNSNALSGTTQEVGRQLNALAGEQFDLAQALADGFQRPEMRVLALIEIAHAALAEATSGTLPPRPPPPPPPSGRGFGSGLIHLVPAPRLARLSRED